MIRKTLLACALVLAAMPAVAEDSTASDGFNLLEEGAKLLLRGLVEEIEPTMRDFADALDKVQPQLKEFAEGMGPKLNELGALLGDLNAYHAPERLPNGDIILRRKVPETEPPETGESAPIDL